ncbi:MAG: hypothetical protein LBF23_02335 [Endomicrobium sp.]|jgi:type I restriction enzyme S subunit|nr:hypothetical protein [Endomicrobium sp.]
MNNISVRYFAGKFNAYQRTYVITTNKYFFYIYQFYKDKIREIANGAIVSVNKFLTKSMLENPIIKIPNNIEKFEVQAAPIFEKILNISEDNARLNQLKNLYLKKFF